jgi:uncharacterized membrane protein YtjA (UPF0391 family)
VPRASRPPVPADNKTTDATGAVPRKRGFIMLKLALVFFLISLVAGFFGFTNIAAGTATIAKWLFGIAVVIFVILLVLGLMAGEVLF